MSDTTARAKLVAGLLTQLVNALRRGSEEQLLQILSESITSGLDGPAIYLELFQPALERIGHHWEAGEICVGEEHQASSLIRWLMSALWDDFNPRSYREGFRPLLAGCAQGERHEIGLEMVSDFLRRDGWHVIDLGADVPELSFLRRASSIQPPVCLLSAAHLQTAENLLSVASQLLALPFQTRILLGGSVFRGDPTLAASLGPAVSAMDADEAVLQVHRLLGV